MARELSQEALLDFLCQAGGRVTNAALLGHFKRFLRDPAPAGQVQQRREQFKSLVNSVATVQQEAGGGPKYVVLRKRYRDLLGEELGPPAVEPPPGPGRCQGQGLAGASPGKEAAPPAAQPGSGAGSPGGQGSGARCAARAHAGLQEQQRQAPPGRLPRDHPRVCPGGAGRGAPGLPQANAGRQGAEPPPAPAWAADGQGHPSELAVATAGFHIHRADLRALPGAPCAPAGLQQQWIQEWVERSRDAGQAARGSCSAPRSPDGTCTGPARPLPEAGWRFPPPIFMSIRCQLALQDLEDFVEQASPGSEEGSGGGTGSEGSESLQEAGDRGANPAGGAGDVPRDPGALDSCCQQLSNGAPSGRSQRRANRQVVEVNGTAPCTRHSFRSKSARGSSRVSSSEDELRDQDQGRRGRRPRRSRKMAKGAILASPGVDTPITFQYLGSVQRQICGPTEEALPVPQMSLDPRPSSMPLDPREHNWIVRVAAGSWVQVRALFLEDPQLALQRDFISGYTALHWIAKHGASQVLQDLVSGAEKAGTPLDVNVKSSCGYTPLHLAAIHGHQRIMKLLIQKLNSKVHVRDSSGKRPWQYLSSSTSGEMWQLLGAPKGKTIFPTQTLVRHSSPPRKAKSQEVARSISRKTSLAACLKPKHMKWKMATKYPALREQEEYSD